MNGYDVSLKGRFQGFGLYTGMIAASGDVQLFEAMDSVMVVGGDVKQVAFLHRCILICDGNVELLWPPISGSLIIAHGKVNCAHGKLTNCLIRNGPTLQLPDGKTVVLKDGTPDPLAFVKFFELADVGLTAEDLPPRDKSDAKGVWLAEVRKDSPFASGLRTGDVITALEEKETPTTEIFRKLLRRKLSEGEPIITFTVRRAGKTLDVPIAVKD